MMTVASLSASSIKAQALKCGFDLCGISRAEKHPRLARLSDWIAEGRAGDMQYLADSLDERLDPAQVLPTARSVVSLAVSYNSEAANHPDPKSPSPQVSKSPNADDVVIARYARGADYHDVLRARLRALLEWMVATAGPGFEAFSCVDNGPVQERVFAEQAGLGWIGKNTCLINTLYGSWIFLAEILTNAELEPDTPGVDQCGSCTRCLEACPTGALTEAGALDATRCLSYLTIETRAPVAAPLRPAIAQEIYGCDICQDVCPWNRRAAATGDPAWQPRSVFAAPRLLDLCRFPDEAWRAELRTSAMQRAGLRRIRRSLAYAAARLPAGERADALAALAAHPSGDDAGVRDAIRWASEAGPAARG